MSTLKALNEEAARQGKVHKVVLMIDLGDLREGMFFKNEDEIFSTVEAVEATYEEDYSMMDIVK